MILLCNRPCDSYLRTFHSYVEFNGGKALPVISSYAAAGGGKLVGTSGNYDGASDLLEACLS